jgi:hypothetical protein
MCCDDLTATVHRDGDCHGLYVVFEMVKDREFVVGSFLRNLAEHRESQ